MTAKQDNGKGHTNNKAEPCGALSFLLQGLILLPIIMVFKGLISVKIVVPLLLIASAAVAGALMWQKYFALAVYKRLRPGFIYMFTIDNKGNVCAGVIPHLEE